MRKTKAISMLYYPYTSSSPLSWKKALLLVTLIRTLIAPAPSPLLVQAAVVDASESRGIGGHGGFRWQILTRSNFSSQIRLHPHLLLLVTVPWSGESRSLMKELAERIATERQEYGSLKLMLLYRNRERMLADAIGASDAITIIFYHHSLPYKYRGRLRSLNILSSLHFLMSLPSEQLPIQFLDTQRDVRTFLQSADKAVLLLEFCGWTKELLAKGKENGTADDYEVSFGSGNSGETDGPPVMQRKKPQVLENEKMTCDAQTGFNGIPWLGEFCALSQTHSNNSRTDEFSCSSEKFQQFESFFTKLVNVAREFFLPPERLQFGLVADRSLLSVFENGGSSSWLSYLNVVDPNSWLAILYFSGCPTCLVVVREGDDLKGALLMQNPLLTELGDGGDDPVPTLPANKPSILLFIDRSSDSLEARRRSKEALDAFRNLAFQYHRFNDVALQPYIKNSLLKSYQRSKSFSGHQNKFSSTPPNIALNDKVSILDDKLSITVINEGKHVTLDRITSGLQGNSLHEILAYLLQHQNEVKLSSLAKEAGFQLLSEDFDIKLQEAALPTPTNVVESDQGLSTHAEVLPEVSADLHKEHDTPFLGDMSPLENDEQHKTNQRDESFRLGQTTTLGFAEETSEQKIISEMVNFDEKLPSMHFKQSFFFSDGGYQLLRALTASSKIPSAVIVDPIRQKHYVLNEESDFSYSLLSDFVKRFVNGSLVPYQQSASGVQSPREAPSPPFVNLDFHAVGSIPHVTANTFSELVIGFNGSDSSAPGCVWRKDVVVLFSNSWCGFCQRMELVVREVYGFFKHYAAMIKIDEEKSSLTDTFKDMESRLPHFYFMDCTLNECNWILRSAAQREIYPSLLLFPAESKIAVAYEGDIAVSDVIKFVADHGYSASDLVKEKGTLWTQLRRENRKQNMHDVSHMSVHEQAPLQRDKRDEVVFENHIQEEVVRYNEIRPSDANASQRVGSPVIVGSLLIATEKLLNVRPFGNSIILIVKVDEGTGFQGLIINKHISWDSIKELEEGLEQLKDARLSFGGPLFTQGMPLVALTRRTNNNHYPGVLPNVCFLDPWGTVHEIEGLKSSNRKVTDYWFFLGYSSWGWDQLFDEINQGAWSVSGVEYEDLDWPWR